MKQAHDKEADSGLLEEYDFSGGVRGKYAERFVEGHNLVFLEPDVAKAFPDSASVNEALRSLSKESASSSGEVAVAG